MVSDKMVFLRVNEGERCGQKTSEEILLPLGGWEGWNKSGSEPGYLTTLMSVAEVLTQI